MVTFDYGADADALIWQHIAHPNHEGAQKRRRGAREGSAGRAAPDPPIEGNPLL